MPMRENAMTPAKPDSNIVETSTQVLLFIEVLNKAVDNKLNLATNPDNGGSPTINKAHAKKARPRKIIGRGNGIPTASSRPSSSPKSRRSKASSLTANNSEPKG